MASQNNPDPPNDPFLTHQQHNNDSSGGNHYHSLDQNAPSLTLPLRTTSRSAAHQPLQRPHFELPDHLTLDEAPEKKLEDTARPQTSSSSYSEGPPQGNTRVPDRQELVRRSIILLDDMVRNQTSLEDAEPVVAETLQMLEAMGANLNEEDDDEQLEEPARGRHQAPQMSLAEFLMTENAPHLTHTSPSQNVEGAQVDGVQIGSLTNKGAMRLLKTKLKAVMAKVPSSSKPKAPGYGLRKGLFKKKGLEFACHGADGDGHAGLAARLKSTLSGSWGRATRGRGGTSETEEPLQFLSKPYSDYTEDGPKPSLIPPFSKSKGKHSDINISDPVSTTDPATLAKLKLQPISRVRRDTSPHLTQSKDANKSRSLEELAELQTPTAGLQASDATPDKKAPELSPVTKQANLRRSFGLPPAPIPMSAETPVELRHPNHPWQWHNKNLWCSDCATPAMLHKAALGETEPTVGRKESVGGGSTPMPPGPRFCEGCGKACCVYSELVKQGERNGENSEGEYFHDPKPPRPASPPPVPPNSPTTPKRRMHQRSKAVTTVPEAQYTFTPSPGENAMAAAVAAATAAEHTGLGRRRRPSGPIGVTGMRKVGEAIGVYWRAERDVARIMEVVGRKGPDTGIAFLRCERCDGLYCPACVSKCQEKSCAVALCTSCWRATGGKPEVVRAGAPWIWFCNYHSWSIDGPVWR